MLHERLVLPTQWNCYLLSCERKISGTPEIVENHEALGKDIHLSIDTLGTKEYNFSSWNWTHTVSATQGCSSKWIEAWTYILKLREFQIEWAKSHTHTLTHTHTHTNVLIYWYFSAEQFLNSIYWIERLNRQEVTVPQDILCTPSIPTIWMWGFPARILMHT
jgi:hypothetical protein